MRKIVAIFAALFLVMPATIMAQTDCTAAIDQLLLQNAQLKDQINVLQTKLTTSTEELGKLIDNENLKLSQHISDQTDPFRQSAPNILLISILVSAYFVFRGMDLIYRKIRKQAKRGVE